MKPDEAKSRGTEDWTDRVFARQRSAPQYHERVAAVRGMLARRHVAPEIIDRVIRLNPMLQEGMILRGIHYTTTRDREPVWMHGMWRRGQFLREHGRDAWDRLPKWSITKQGRREYVTREAVLDQLWLAA